MPALVWAAVAALVLGVAGCVALLVARPVKVDAARLRPELAGGPARRASTADETVAVAQRLLHRFDARGRLATSLDLAGVGTAAPDVVVVVGIGTLTALLLGAVLGGPLLALLLAAAVPAGTWAWLARRVAGRRRAFAEQLDDALQLMASSLRAGHSLLRAVDAVSRDTVAPMADEFARVVNEARVGRDLTAALGEVADRTGSEDFRWVVQAIGVHREVGGNLAEVLDRVGETLRDRAQLFRQARALSAEGRTSGVVLLAMPFGVALVMSLTSPGYLAPLVDSGTGWVLLLIAAGLMTGGALWLRSIVKVRF
ncbi:type II secretion system F family protein [Klenkia brasiliensis]|uniref:Tight adherence protein B n=1 Tax=Klenkia brasiliensis TaxID=333142 RepID=A0A1G7V012_9ACTN|nr:type II secretion system F family protein [Klenkia brasiliensis]SDG53087.1 tight adherence protein B [Klenkia brasiliensis]